MRLDDVADSRENNFNLLRIVAASAVLVSHSYPLSLGPKAAEPLSQSLGVTLGSVAVDVFFVVSGFLVTASLVRRQSSLDFIIGRFLRIFPGLWVMVLLTLVVLGPAVTQIPVSEYFLGWDTKYYLAKCATLVTGVAFNLPGVFVDNPYPRAVNGSLWTMPIEVQMYGLLLVSWLLLRWAGLRSLRWLQGVVGITCLASVCLHIGLRLSGQPASSFVSLLFAFSAGALMYLFRNRIVLRPGWFLAAVGLLALSTLQRESFNVTYALVMPYLVISLAYMPAGAARAYNRIGDYSYGVYVYAFPVQQWVVYSSPGIAPLTLMLISLPATLVLAVASWHLVEWRALQSKPAVVAAFRRSKRVV